MMKFCSMIAVAGVAMGLFALSPAMAVPSDTWQLTGGSASSDNCPGSPADCGSVTAYQSTANQLQINVDLAPHTVFADTGAGSDLIFVLSVNLPKSDFSLPAGWGLTINQITGVGTEYVLGCGSKGGGTACGNGTSPPNVSSLVFEINDTGILLADILPKVDGTNYFDSDVGSGANCPGTCSTGAVNTGSSPPVTGQGNPTPIPEPMTIALFGAGLAGIGGTLRRRKAKKSA